MHWKVGIWICFSVIAVFIFRASSLQCMDSEINGIRNCSSPDDVCFQLITRDTEKVTKGCYNRRVCEDIGNDTDCSLCHTDLCNSGSTSNKNLYYISLMGITIILGFTAT